MRRADNKPSSRYKYHIDSSLNLWQVAAGREWYIHTIYTVRSSDNANRGISKRSMEYHSFVAHNTRARRSNRDVPAIAEMISAEYNRGTNIMHIALAHQQAVQVGEAPAEGLVQHEMDNSGSEEEVVMTAGVSVGLLLFGLITTVFFLMLRSQSSPEKEVRKRSENEGLKVPGSMQPIILRSGFEGSNGSEV